MNMNRDQSLLLSPLIYFLFWALRYLPWYMPQFLGAILPSLLILAVGVVNDETVDNQKVDERGTTNNTYYYQPQNVHGGVFNWKSYWICISHIGSHNNFVGTGKLIIQPLTLQAESNSWMGYFHRYDNSRVAIRTFMCAKCQQWNDTIGSHA